MGKAAAAAKVISFDLSRRKLEAMTEDTVKLKCSFYNVHHEIDMDRFSVEWIATKYQQQQRKRSSSNAPAQNSGEETLCQEKMKNAPMLIMTDPKPKCIVSMDFPFEDLTTSIKNISCTSSLLLENITINDTFIYTCRAKIAFKARKNTEKSNSFYEMSTYLMVRVSRRNDYYVHKIVALVIGSVVVITLLLLVGKKVLGHKLGWENREACNYAQEWPNSVPARRIADAGSMGNLSTHHSRSTLR